jgi:hypothetical protein
MRRLGKAVGVLALLALSGCGSSGTAADAGPHGSAGSTGAAGAKGGAGSVGSTGGAGADGGVPTGEITWLDDGTPHALGIALATRLIGNMTDSLEIVGVDTTGTYSLTIAVGGPMTLGGTYTCSLVNNANIAEITYTSRVLIPSSCMVMVTLTTDADGGAPHATGTFSFDITKEAGTESITDGRFDIPVTMETP